MTLDTADPSWLHFSPPSRCLKAGGGGLLTSKKGEVGGQRKTGKEEGAAAIRTPID